MFKQLHYFKSWLLLMLCMVVGVGSAWAQDADVTYDIAKDFSVSGSNLTDGTVTFTGYGKDNFKKNSGYFMMGKNGAYINFPIYSSPVKKIVVTGNSGASGSTKMNIYVGDDAVSTETIGSTGTNTYEIASASQAAGTQYTLKVTSSHNAQITKIEVFYAAASETTTTVTIDDSGITNTDVYDTSTSAGSLAATVNDNAGQAISGATVTWSSSDESVATIAANGAVTLVAAGTTTITASYAGVSGTYDPSEATYELTVTNSDPNQPGTVNNPYTVAEAIANTPSSGTTANVYIKGIVSQFFGADITDDNYHRYYISDDGTTSTQLLVFGGKGLNDVAFSSADDLLLGDEVVIVGQLKTYSNAPEVAGDNYIVTLNRKQMPDLAFEEDSYEVAILGALTITASSNDSDGEITYESSDDAIASIDATTGEVTATAAGTVTITATIAPTATYKGTTATVELTVLDPRQDVTLSFGETPATINIGSTATYAVTTDPAGLEDDVTYSSSDDNIVSVDPATGEITANAVGTATITATFPESAEYTEATDSYEIQVVDPNAPTTVYKKVTSTADITDGEYLIVYEGDDTHNAVAFDGSLTTLDAVGNGVAVTINTESNEITGSTAIDAAVFTITAVENGYTIKNAANLYIGTSSDNNGLSAKETAQVNTISIDGDADIVSAGGAYLRYNSASNQMRFRYFKSSSYTNQQPIALYKKSSTLPVTITTAGAASFSSKYALDFSKVSELTAYKATAVNKTTVHLDEVAQVPAGAGVIVKGAEGTYQVPVVTGDVAALDGNLLVGTAEAEYTVGDDYGKVFKYVKTKAGVVGFQKAKADWTCQIGHAYLKLSETPAREYLNIFGEEPIDDVATGINSIDNSQWTMDNDAPAYNLAGQKVGKGYKGIVVKNGKKYVK